MTNKLNENYSVQPLEPRERRKRKRELVATFFLFLLFIGLTFAEFRLTKLSSTLPFVNSIFFFGLLNINIILLIAIVWLVLRNLGKLFIERRRRVLGARLKTKLVISFLSFSIIPTLTLFIISALYINSSFDKWFSLKIQNTFQASLEITRTYYRNTGQTAIHFAEHLSKSLAKRVQTDSKVSLFLRVPRNSVSYLPVQMPNWVHEFLETQRELLALDAVEFYADPFDERAISSAQKTLEYPAYYPRLPLDLLEKAFAGDTVSQTQHIGAGDLIRCLVPVKIRTGSGVIGVIVVNSYIPVNLVNQVDEIASVFEDYRESNPLKYPIKSAYFVILVMMTLVILFVAIWIGLYMARELTVPVERLVYGAQQVGAGNLDFTISGGGHDEIAVLVDSFNRMTGDLRDNRERLTHATEESEKRRLQLEAVLANVGTGVIVVDREGIITTFNHSVALLLELSETDAIGHHYAEVLQNDAVALIQVIQNALMGQDQGNVFQWNYRSKDHSRSLSAVSTVLREAPGALPWGAVLVVDDLSHMAKAQREMAWREVARRIAHEIKNPLTPIKLSAQRMQRRISNDHGRDAEILRECTETIIKHTDEMKELVNEFSNFARFPEISPAPHDLNEALAEVVALYRQAHPEITFRFDPELKLSVFEFDRDQLKRVVINLLDNGVAALNSASEKPNKTIRVAIHYNDQLHMVAIDVSDNGPGMTDEVKVRLFEPYFSTKAEGTGLGLAIAKRIINDHDGFIRVHSVLGEGTQFLIELPVESNPKVRV